VPNLLRCQPFQEEFYRNGKGIVADLWSTNYSAMRDILLGMPPVPEQTLSHLNRAHPGKHITYVVDFVNDPEEVLASFKAYHTTAELSATTDPNLVFNLRQNSTPPATTTTSMWSGS